MRRIIVSEFISLDGVIGAPDEWHFQFWNDDMARAKHAELFACDALLLGRDTYQGFAAAWPTEAHLQDMKDGVLPDGEAFTYRMNSLPKYVASRTLTEPLAWNAALLKGNVAEAVSRLKQQQGQDILLLGSAELAQTLTDNDLIDEYRLMVHPIVVGKGKRLFKGDSALKKLKLIELKPTNTGVVFLTYTPDR